MPRPQHDSHKINPSRSSRTASRDKQGFVEQRRAIDAAAVSLELALVYLEQNQFEKIKHLAEEMVFIFRSHGIHREAIAAMIFFQKAAEREAIEASFIAELATYLERAEMNPELQFRGSEHSD